MAQHRPVRVPPFCEHPTSYGSRNGDRGWALAFPFLVGAFHRATITLLHCCQDSGDNCGLQISAMPTHHPHFGGRRVQVLRQLSRPYGGGNGRRRGALWLRTGFRDFVVVFQTPIILRAQARQDCRRALEMSLLAPLCKTRPPNGGRRACAKLSPV